MKITSARLTAPETIELESRTLEPRPDRLLVRNLACGICHSEKAGWLAGPGGGDGRWLGHEPVGEIVEVGAEVGGPWQVGQRITGFWGPGMASHSLVDPRRCVPVPDGLKTEHALGEVLGCLVTCARGWAFEFGADACLIGCGFMGVLSMQAIAGTALNLIAVDLSDERLAFARACGATHTVRADQDPVAAVHAITDGRMCNPVVEATGLPEGLRTACDLVGGWRPVISCISYYNREVHLPDLAGLAHKAVQIRNPHPSWSPDTLADVARGLQFAARGTWSLDRAVTHTWPLEQCDQAYRTAMRGEDGYVKGVVTMPS